ncbi:hypothetical protein [Sphingobacterium haloxyli]|uniref:Uncharacterized protein n=1 Tax=Sphingobacterium haloxyli TaxID=2100533 RepID=A0A2S9IWV8_9SPHI|nr:hypothetical protein [Sphingobacterium haloxyli]PRD45005.1 hypothetical protein C5745_18735 [Sphingobacterium haloxyli]
MFEKFQTAVRNAYLDLKNEGRLDFGRECPSPGELRSWCLERYLRGLSPEDESVFIYFFNRERSTKDLATIIESFDLDKLRPLRNFISGDTQRRPDENIVKLLAVLIDFKPRPYKASHWDERVYTGGLINDEENPSTSGSNSGDSFVEPPGTDRAEKGAHTQKAVEPEKVENTEYKEDALKPIEIKRRTKNNKLLYTGIGLAVVTVLFVVYNIFTSANCMCWNGERYVEVDCQDKGQPYQVIGLDKNKLVHFQKITRPDTLNHENARQVWYSKINNEVEFFTYPGHHPVEYGRSLKAATEYIIDRYAGERTTGE